MSALGTRSTNPHKAADPSVAICQERDAAGSGLSRLSARLRTVDSGVRTIGRYTSYARKACNDKSLASLDSHLAKMKEDCDVLLSQIIGAQNILDAMRMPGSKEATQC